MQVGKKYTGISGSTYTIIDSRIRNTKGKLG
ncbi:uncharacterized protein METZ01_LOCUS429354, partial [marine metagenome]